MSWTPPWLRAQYNLNMFYIFLIIYMSHEAAGGARHSPMLPLLGAFKLAKGLLILAVPLGVLHLVPGDPADTLERRASELHIDPDGPHSARGVQPLVSRAARPRTA